MTSGTARIAAVMLAALGCAAGARAEEFSAQLDAREFRLIAVLEGGRKKPLDTYARERIEFITGKAAWRGEEPAVTLLSMVFETEKWETAEMFKVSHPELVAMMDRRRDGKLRNVFSYRELVEHAQLREEIHRRIQAQGRGGGAREKGVDEILAKINWFAALGAKLTILPPPPGFPKDDWHAFEESGGRWTAGGAARDLYAPGWLDETEKQWAALAAAFRAHDAAATNRAMADLAPRLAAVNPEKYPARGLLVVEHVFMAWQPFRVAWIIYAVACVLLALRLGIESRKLYGAGFGLLCAGFAAHLAGVGMRAYVAQRAPWADLYETVVVTTLMCVAFAIVFEAIHRSAYIGLAAGFLSAAGLVGASMLPFDFRTLDPLVPVLRSWWLKYHVLSMICSYGAFTLAFGISAIHLYVHFAKRDAAGAKKLEDLTYRVIQVGFFFITVGIILGAVWADSAWGRYWGWDPKEIWALVSWFIYGAYIHGRMIGWCRGPRAAYASILGYAAILFTFFGVNFVLTGLHSYANAS